MPQPENQRSNCAQNGVWLKVQGCFNITVSLLAQLKFD